MMDDVFERGCPLGAVIRGTAESVQVLSHMSMLVLPVLTVVSGLMGKCQLHSTTRTEPNILWTAVAADPGNTPVSILQHMHTHTQSPYCKKKLKDIALFSDCIPLCFVGLCPLDSQDATQ